MTELVFYSVDNKMDFTPHSFNGKTSDEISEMLGKLDDDEIRRYKFSTLSEAFVFVDDYNLEMLNDGWWCIAL